MADLSEYKVYFILLASWERAGLDLSFQSLDLFQSTKQTPFLNPAKTRSEYEVCITMMCRCWLLLLLMLTMKNAKGHRVRLFDKNMELDFDSSVSSASPKSTYFCFYFVWVSSMCCMIFFNISFF